MNRPVRVKKDSGSAQCWILSGYRVRIVPELSIYPQYLRMKKQSALTYWTIPSHKMPLFCCLKSWAVRAETDLVPLSKRPPCWKCDKRDRANDYTSLIAARHASSKNRLNVGFFPFSKRPPIKRDVTCTTMINTSLFKLNGCNIRSSLKVACQSGQALHSSEVQKITLTYNNFRYPNWPLLPGCVVYLPGRTLSCW